MPSTFSGLIAALSQGAQGYQAGTNDAEAKRVADATRAQQRAIQLHAQQRQDAMDAEKMAMDRAGMAAKGIDMGGATVSLTPPAAAPATPPFDPSALSAGASSPSALVRPVDLGGVSKVSVNDTGPSYNPENDRSIEAINARSTAAMDRLTQTLDSRESIAGENRDSRESVAGANRASREGIAAQRLAAQNANRGVAIDATGKEIGGRPVTGTARIGHIIKLTTIYTKPVADGGLGLDPQTAQLRAQNDVDAIIAHGRQRAGGAASMAPSGATPPAEPPPTSTVIPSDQGKPATDAVAIAVQHLKDGIGTMAQLEASDATPAFKAAVKRQLGNRTRPGASSPPPRGRNP